MERRLDDRKKYLKLLHRYLRRGYSPVYIDESGFEPHAMRLFGYSPIGQRIYGLKSGQKRPRTSLLAAQIGRNLEAPLLFQGTCNTEVFNTWIEEQLLPLLHEKSLVIMDNAIFHKSQKTKDLIESKGAKLLFLPPYSPDLNPIEKKFGSLKRFRQYNAHLSLDEIIKIYR